jgi:hypothetical protein
MQSANILAGIPAEFVMKIPQLYENGNEYVGIVRACSRFVSCDMWHSRSSEYEGSGIWLREILQKRTLFVSWEPKDKTKDQTANKLQEDHSLRN